MNKVLNYFPMFVILLLTACSGGGSGTTTTTTSNTPPSTNFSLPTKVSPVSTSSATGTNKVGLRSKLFALRTAATDPGTDYSNAEKVTYVDEHALDQFKIIGQVLNALAQTHYNDDAVSGNGPYKAMVAWQDEEGGVKRKTLEPWIVDSKIVEEDGTTPRHRLVQAWIDEGGQVIKAAFQIFSPASKNTDGSYLHFGTWKINVKFDATGTSFFAAEATLGTNGESIIKIHENFDEGAGFVHETRAILHKTATGGFGQVSYPNWDACTTTNCTPTIVTTKYTYDANHIAVKVGLNPTQFKDRNSVVEMIHLYGLYDSLTGADILKEKNFGFPVEYPDPIDPTITRYAYYGAWQGRHELWADAGPVPVGTVVTRADFLSGQTAPTYKVAPQIRGTLSKRSISQVSLDDLKGIPFEVWTNQSFLIQWDTTTSAWQDCVDPVFNAGAPATCPTAPFDHFVDLVMLPGDYRRFVSIHREGDPNDYIYDPTPGSEGFYPATFDQNGTLVATPGASALVPGPQEELWIDISGSIFVQKVDLTISNTGWVIKQVASFDQRTHQPIFKDAALFDKKWPPDPGREYYINNNGDIYILKRTKGLNGAPDIDEVWIETQTVANPTNAATLAAANTIFKHQFEPLGVGTTSTYQFITDPTHTNYLKLVYLTVGTEDLNLGVLVGDVVTEGLWGLRAFVGGIDSGDEFNWDYPPDGENWGLITYLQTNDANMDYVLIDDPIRFSSVGLTTRGGSARTLNLQYDGWMHGLPDLFDDLMRNNFVFDTFLSNKIINIPDGTTLTDASSGRTYITKQLEVSQFLQPLTGTSTLDITVADALNLNSVPDFVAHGMGGIPVVTGVKYSEGILVQ
ncbi:MAG: hypothetical protein ACE5FY_00215 [Nitrospiria bacterium]